MGRGSTTIPTPTLFRTALVGLALVAGCRDDEQEKSPPAAKPDPAEFRAQAHRQAFDRLVPLAQATLQPADPVAAAQRGLAELAAPPLSLTRRAAIDPAYDTAWLEAQDIDGDALEPAPAMLLKAIRFALTRVHDQRGKNDPARTDLGWAIHEAERFVSALEWDATADACPPCNAALAGLGSELAAAGRILGASSQPSLQASHADLLALRGRIEALSTAVPSLRDGARATNAELTTLADAVQTQLGQLPATATTTWREAVRPAGGKKLARLPNRLGAETLRRRLDVEESVTMPLERAFTRLGPAVGRLQHMRDAVPPAVKAASDPPAPVTVARCQPALERIREWAGRHPRLTAGNVDCEQLVRRLGPEPMTDAQLLLALVRWGLVEPARLARMRDEAAVLALVTGRIAPDSQAHATTIAVLAGMEESAALILALDGAHHAVCLAATALWIHAELGTDAALTQRLESECAQRPPDQWIADAEARPRRALAGLGLMHMGTGPAEVVALERYWWAPIGMVADLANPPRPNDRPDPAVRVHIESLEPDPPARAASGTTE